MKTLEFKALLNACRLPHLVKNLLLCMPLLLSHRFHEWNLWKYCIIGFVAFSFASCSIYLINDVCDINFDQAHPGKNKRALVTGAISSTHALILSVITMTLSFLICITQLPIAFTKMVVIYIVIACSYSLYLKRFIIIDILVLSSLYTLRLYAGAVLVSVPLSFWLIAFSLFFFSSLALAKRLAELVQIKNSSLSQIPGRAYKMSDEGILQTIGYSTAIASLILYALYIHNPAIKSLYETPEILWISFYAIFYWLTRLWILVKRGDLTSDPITWALKDIPSYLTLAIVIASFYFAI